MGRLVQRNYRLPVDLLERFEGFVEGRGRSAAVREAVSEWCDRRRVPWPSADSVADGPVEPARFARVANAAGRGSLVRLEGFDREAWAPGVLVRAPSGELMRVRRVDGDVLSVDRGQGTAVSDLAVGDELCVVGRVGDSEVSSAAVAGPAGDGAAVDGGRRETGSAARTDGQAAVSSPPSEPSSASVELAPWLSGRTGLPAAVCRRRIADGRVSFDGAPVLPSEAAAFPRSDLGGVLVDGEPVA